MRSEILRELHSEYEQQRMQNMRVEDMRRMQAVSACPEIGALLEERQDMVFRSLRGILDGAVAADDLPLRMEVINGRIASLLQEKGFAADWLDPVYRCPKCKDSGYVGEPVREMCDCLRTAFFSRLYKRVGLAEAQEQSFEKFDLNVFSDKPMAGMPFSQRQEMAIIRDECLAFADGYPQGAGTVLMTGKSGLGKTFLMHAMAKRLLDRGFNVLMVSAYRFLDTARKAYFTGRSEELDSLMDTDVLLIDDLGSEPLMENITIVQLFNLINERQTAGKGLIISTNLNETELRERYTERIASRLTDKRQCRMIKFHGDDVRRA